MAKTRPPNETMLPAAAPVDSGAEPLAVALPAVPEVAAEVAADADEAAEDAAPELAAGMVELPPTMGVTIVGTGATGVAVGTTMVLVLVRVAVRVTMILLVDCNKQRGTWCEAYPLK